MCPGIFLMWYSGGQTALHKYQIKNIHALTTYNWYSFETYHEVLSYNIFGVSETDQKV